MKTLTTNKGNSNSKNSWVWISRSSVLTLLIGLTTACTSRPVDDNVAVSPVPEATSTVAVTPAPQPTATVVVTPAPQPTATVVVTPAPQPTSTVVVTPAPEPTPTVAVVTEPITDLVVVNSKANKQLLANKQAQLTDIKVQSVVGDRAFWVGSSNTQRLFVLLAQKLDAGSAENKIVVKPGQTVDLAGVLRPLPPVQSAPQQIKGLNKTEAQALKNQGVYLEARNINFN